MDDIDLTFYKMNLHAYTYAVDSSAFSTIDLKLQSDRVGTKPDLEGLMRDVTLMNTIRSSTDPAVEAAFEQLLTTMALTNGRSVANIVATSKSSTLV